MKIVFNLMNCGLGNNGGSLTLIKSANTLQELGHEVYIIDSMENQYTWGELKVPHIIIKERKNIPNSDIILATGYNTWKHTLNLPNRCGKKYVWVRGWEIWNSSEKNIVSILSDKRIIKLVNSICLKNKLLSYKIQSYIIRPGNEFEDLYPMDMRNDDKIILGGLYHTRHMTKRSDWVIKTAKILKQKHKNIELYMFGTNKDPKNVVIDKYLSQPDIIEKNEFFNKINIFLTPSTLEGLHIVPQEAMMTGCPVVATNAEMSGTQDYMVHGVTGYISENNLDSFIHYTELLYKSSDTRKQMGREARKQIIKLGSREENMQTLIDFVMGIIK